jgi:hypothetical protein
MYAIKHTNWLERGAVNDALVLKKNSRAEILMTNPGFTPVTASQPVAGSAIVLNPCIDLLRNKSFAKGEQENILIG